MRAFEGGEEGAAGEEGAEGRGTRIAVGHVQISQLSQGFLLRSKVTAGKPTSQRCDRDERPSGEKAERLPEPNLRVTHLAPEIAHPQPRIIPETTQPPHANPVRSPT
ncbi:hypothetical protein GCM10010251_63890 [Streptomyces aurantiogriseus]|uniref:Uncharacterized protein n=1 Tax=Streptomyces aurantiogriseus TaxID=66870 RepID=A0A918FHT0_9ACTN|nr:hypothetical protein GCM10010251_63890 [Streptomyces aurantiogriseus]